MDPYSAGRPHERDVELPFDIVIVVAIPPRKVGQQVDRFLLGFEAFIASLQLHLPGLLPRGDVCDVDALIDAEAGCNEGCDRRDHRRNDSFVGHGLPPGRTIQATAASWHRTLVPGTRWRAYVLPWRRFADTLADAHAWPGADVERYSFIAADVHHLLLARFYRRTGSLEIPTGAAFVEILCAPRSSI
jgi:hypothetical protein